MKALKINTFLKRCQKKLPPKPPQALPKKVAVKPCLIVLCASIAFAAYGQTVENNALSAFNLGQQAFRQDRILDSIRYFQQAISFNANYSDAYREIARSFYYLGETREAQSYIQSAIELAPQEAANQTLRARILLANGEIENAHSIFLSVLENDPFNSEAQTGLGELSLAQGNIVQSREFFQGSNELYPEDYRILISLAHIYRVQGRSDLAENYLDIALEVNDQDPWLHLYIADYYFLAANYAQAEIYAMQALLLEANFLPAIELLSRIYIHSENFQEAVNFLRRINAEELRENQTHLYTVALAEYNAGNTESALQTLEAALGISPDNEFNRMLYEGILIRERDFDDRQRERSAQYHFNRAGEFLERGQNSSAFYHYTRGLEIAPFSAEGRLGYARYFREQGEYARYINQIEFIIDQLGIESQNLEDDREVFSDLLRDSVSSNWNTDQFLVERSPFSLAVFLIDGRPLEHSFSDRLVAEQFMDRLFISSLVEFPPVPAPAESDSAEGGDITESGNSIASYAPIIINSYNEAFSIARSNALGYYIVLHMSEGDRRIDVSAEIFLARTGRLLSANRVTRSGITRVKNAVISLSNATLNSLPVRAEILERNFESALINRGTADGTAQGDSFHIIDPQNISLHNSRLGFSYNEEDVIGRAEVSQADAFISELSIETLGFFDSINAGDIVFLPPNEQAREQRGEQADGQTSGQPNEAPNTSTAPRNGPTRNISQELYERIRQIR